MPQKLSEEKIRELIADEKKGYEEYHKYGLNSLARDEHRHKIFLENLLKRCK